MAEPSNLTVGSTVRCKLPDHPKAWRKAVIATVQEDSVCVIWEDEAPRPKVDDSSVQSPHHFLIVPLFTDGTEGTESTVTVKSIVPLLDFELDSCQDEDSRDIEVWKGRGDKLLRLGDASAAALFYEYALKLSSHVEIGGSVIIKVGGYPKIAEVDCVEDDSIDILLVENGEERTIQENEILLCILDNDEKGLQQRILLNLARCLLQLAETTISERRPLYLRKAVLAATLGHTVADYRDKDDRSTQTTVFLLRAQAQAARAKFPHALADIKTVLELDPDNREGRRLQRDIERQQMQQKRSDKKLVKEMCQWVKSATNNESVSEAEVPRRSDDKVIEADNQIPRKGQQVDNDKFLWFGIALILLIVAVLIQKIGPSLVIGSNS